mmetsp:Transcript_7191/g.16402  ORF Transcript_7191/g.16402 Transcript_7191/m.16402 type:complete len:206 (-) Transcript_7191:146-763(-)
MGRLHIQWIVMMRPFPSVSFRMISFLSFLNVSKQLCSNCYSHSSDHSNIGHGQSRKVDQYTCFSNTIHFICTSPCTTIKGSRFKELVGVLEGCLWIGNTLWIIQITKQQGRHDRIGCFRCEDLIGFEVGHSLIGPGKGAIVYHRNGRRRGSDIGTHHAALATSHNGTPVLHPLGQCIIGTLRYTNTIHHVKVSALSRNWLSCILS